MTGADSQHRRAPSPTSGFTLVEVLTVLLILSLGIGAIIAVLKLANRYTGKALSRFTGMSTASTLLYDHAPLGLTADTGDADGDGWRGTSSFSWTGAYSMKSWGFVNGYWCVREETSAATDIVCAGRRRAWVVVDVFWGGYGNRITRLQECIMREKAP